MRVCMQPISTFSSALCYCTRELLLWFGRPSSSVVFSDTSNELASLSICTTQWQRSVRVCTLYLVLTLLLATAQKSCRHDAGVSRLSIIVVNHSPPMLSVDRHVVANVNTWRWPVRMYVRRHRFLDTAKWIKAKFCEKGCFSNILIFHFIYDLFAFP